MPEAESVLRLPACVDIDAVAALYRDWSPRATQLRTIDFSAVTQIDSAGVALLRALVAQAANAGAPPPQMLHATPRYAQLCLAHRVPAEGN